MYRWDAIKVSHVKDIFLNHLHALLSVYYIISLSFRSAVWPYMISMAKMMEILNYGENVALNLFFCY